MENRTHINKMKSNRASGIELLRILALGGGDFYTLFTGVAPSNYGN